MSVRRRVVAALIAAGLAAPWAPLAAHAAPDNDALPIAVHLAALTPIAPQPGDVLHLSGTLRNVSQSGVTDLAVQLRYSPAHLGSRSEFDQYAENPDGSPAGPMPLPQTTADQASTTLALRSLDPGQSEPFSISVPVDTLHLDQPWEVFPIGIEVVGSTTVGFNAVGGVRTFLPWAPLTQTGGEVPTPVAWVWPLVDQPHRTVGSTFSDDTLATSFASGGRLSNLLAAATSAGSQKSPPAPRPTKKSKKPVKRKPTVAVQPVPVTFAVDPMLVEDASIMAGGYKVAGKNGQTSRTGDAAARQWLQTLRGDAATDDVIALPYADPDVVAATRAGASLANDVQVATRSGQTLVSHELATSPLDYAWPPGGLLDQQTLDTTLFPSGVTTVVLDDRALPPVTEPNLTPSAHTTVQARDGTLDAVLTDHELDAVVNDGARNPPTERLALQRFLAETLMIQAERPSTARPVVITPDRRWNPASAYAASLLADTGKVPWISPVTLPAVVAAAPTPDLPRTGLKYPTQARQAELRPAYLSGVVGLQRSADTFAAILTPGDPNARGYDDATLRTLSSAWRAHGATATTFRLQVAKSLAQTMSRVHIASAEGSFVTLTSHSGTVPITVANDLDTNVRIIVAIEPNQHLQVTGTGRVAQTIPAHRQVAVDVRAAAKTSGVFQLFVSLRTPAGQSYERTFLYVRSTAYGIVALLITGGATGVLLITVAIRLVRRAQAARRSSAAVA